MRQLATCPERSRESLRLLAERSGVCVRPLAIRRTDGETGQTEVVEIPCGARKPCAERNRRDRLAQIRDGWHLDAEPEITPVPARRRCACPGACPGASGV